MMPWPRNIYKKWRGYVGIVQGGYCVYEYYITRQSHNNLTKNDACILQNEHVRVMRNKYQQRIGGSVQDKSTKMIVNSNSYNINCIQLHNNIIFWKW